MAKRIITLETFIDMLNSGSNNLHNNYNLINQLNVFPVPDGDTGTNMSLTMRSGIRAIDNSSKKSFRAISKSLSHGLLMEARGNSGVILSQFFRGFCEVTQTVITKDGLKIKDLVYAFKMGKERAYASVMKPIEGTILTVTRIIYEELEKLDLRKYNVISFFEEIVKISNDTTNKTIEMLDVLKEANLIDSGAKGLTIILEGFLSALKGNIITKVDDEINETNLQLNKPLEDFGFCTEMLIKLHTDVKESAVRKTLAEFGGDSIIVVKSEDLLKFHVHVKEPMEVFEYGFTLGELVKTKSENMTMQANVHGNNKIEMKIKRKKLGVITVGSGTGLISSLYEYGADAVFDSSAGAPAVEDFIKLGKSINAKTVIVLPNDKNFILAAEQARKQSKNLRLRIVSSKTFTEGMAALAVYDNEASLRDNQKEMKRAIKRTKSLELTIASKDTKINNVEIKEGQIILIENGDIIMSGESEIEILEDYVQKEKERSTIEHINIIFGETLELQKQDQIKDIMENYRLAEKKFIKGRNNIFSLLIGFE